MLYFTVFLIERKVTCFDIKSKCEFYHCKLPGLSFLIYGMRVLYRLIDRHRPAIELIVINYSFLCFIILFTAFT